jgi:hypothetical protein
MAIRMQDLGLQRAVDAVAAEMGVAIRLSPELASRHVNLIIEKATVEEGLNKLLVAAGVADYRWAYRPGRAVAGSGWWETQRVTPPPGAGGGAGAVKDQTPVQLQDVVPNEVLVRFAVGMSPGAIAAELARLRVDVLVPWKRIIWH